MGRLASALVKTDRTDGVLKSSVAKSESIHYNPSILIKKGNQNAKAIHNHYRQLCHFDHR